MFNAASFSRAGTLVRSRINALLAILVLPCIGILLAKYTTLTWYLGTALTAFVVALGISGQLILFLLAYKGYERWLRRRGTTVLPPFGTIARIVINGYIRSLWCFFGIVVALSIFHPSLSTLLITFAWIFMGIDIFVTFLSADSRAWDKNASVPIVLSIGFGIQLLFLFLLKLL